MSKSRRLSGLMTLALVVTFAMLTTEACGTIPAPLTPAESDAKSRMQVGETYGKLPLHFETNQGQADGQVKFLARGAGRTLFLTSTEAVLVFTKREQTVTQTVIRMTFLGANPQPRMVGSEELPGKANYFIGKDPAKWRTNVPTYAKVRYANVYPGIDLIYYGNQRQLEYDLVVHPGGDPGAIVLAFHGADKAEVDAQGDLALHTASGAIRQRKPIIYQEIGGVRREIAGAYALEGERVGIRVASYDASRPLVIDPVLDYATYLGGSGDDSVLGIAVDASGNLYVAGQTGSTDFPTSAGAFQPSLGGGAISGPADAVVTKLNPSGSAVVYSTYLGGSDNESYVAIAGDVAGNTYVQG